MQNIKKPDHRVDELPKLFSVARKLSIYDHEHISPTTIKALYARDMYNKFVLHLGTSIKLISEDGRTEGLIDSTILAAIARIIIELHNAFQYLLKRGISKAEFEFRSHMYSLHYLSEIKTINRRFGIGLEAGARVLYNTVRMNTMDSLKENKFFLALDAKTKKEILKGKRAFYMGSIPRRGIGPVAQSVEDGLYKLLSNSIHPFELGLRNYLRVTDDAPFDHWSLVFLSSETILIYSASIIRSYMRLRSGLGSFLSKSEKDYVRMLSKTSRIEEWIAFRRWYEENHGPFHYKED